MKKFVKLLLCGCLCLSLVACGETYEDTNGADDFSLQTITDENILNMDVGSTAIAYSEETVGDVVFGHEYSASNFNGVYEIYTTSYLGNSDVMVSVDGLQVNSGNLRIVVVHEGEIIKDIPLDSAGETFTFEDINGDFSVRIAGESADFVCDIKVY